MPQQAAFFYPLGEKCGLVGGAGAARTHSKSSNGRGKKIVSTPFLTYRISVTGRYSTSANVPVSAGRTLRRTSADFPRENRRQTGRTCAMQFFYWFMDLVEGWVPLITLGMEG